MHYDINDINDQCLEQRVYCPRVVPPPELESRNSSRKAWVWTRELAAQYIESRSGDDPLRVSTRTEPGILRC